MQLWTAFILGLVGSLHCAGMCGPLVLASPALGNRRATALLGRGAYNTGRMISYGILGALFGLIGSSLSGISRWVSLGSGIIILAGFAISFRKTLNPFIAKAAGWVRAGLGKFIQQRSAMSSFLLGSVNGFLPCGLVYAACAVAVTTGSVLSSVSYMIAFGLGTVPMMLGIGLAGTKLQFALRARFQHLIPICLFTTGVLLVLRGLSLGIPYLSPQITTYSIHCPACH